MEHTTRQYSFPNFIADRHADNWEKLELFFENIMDGKNINLIYLNKIIYESVYMDIDTVYKIYEKCITNHLDKIYDNIDILNKETKNKQIVIDNVANLITNFEKRSGIMSNLLSECDAQKILMMKRDEIKNCKGYIDRKYQHSKQIIATCLNEMFQKKINDTQFIKFLDSIIGDDVRNLNVMGNIIQLLDENCILGVISQLNNTKALFLKNIDRITIEVCKPFLMLFNKEPSFIKIYKMYMTTRMEKQSVCGNDEKLEHEKKAISLLNPIDAVDVRYVQQMKSQINDMQHSNTITKIIINNTNINVTSDVYKNITIDKNICKFKVTTVEHWGYNDIKSPVNFPKEIDVYYQIFRKIYEIENIHSETTIEPYKSTGIINITINNNPYNFLVNMYQMGILVRILNETSVKYDELIKELRVPPEELDNILDSLYSCELINCVDDVYTINENFFFKDADISLLNTIDYNEKIDEMYVVDIVEIINSNKCHDISEIIDQFVKKYGMTNYSLIKLVIKYLERKEIVSFIDGVYKLNESKILSIDNDVVSV